MHPNWSQHTLIALISAMAYGLAFWLNDQFTAMLLVTQGVALIYLPAGIKLLAILIGGWPAAVGVGLMLWGLSFHYWTQLDAISLFFGAAISAGTTWAVLTLLLRTWRIGLDLQKLSFSRLLILDAIGSVLHGWLMNLYWVGLGVRDAADLPLAAWGMAMGDFMGSGLILLGLAIALRWSPMRHRLNEH